MSTVVIRTLIVYTVISTVLRLMGKRQVGELELSDLVATLLLSELATLPIADHNVPLLNSLVPVLIILTLEILLTYCKTKFPPLKRLLESRPSVLIRKGVLDQAELGKMRISLEELLSECRLQGYAHLEDVYYAILEQDGKLSVIPRASKSPICADDLQLKSEERGLAYAVVVDGTVNDAHLSSLGLDRNWLVRECKRRGTVPEDVFLMTVNEANGITFIRKDKNSK